MAGQDQPVVTQTADAWLFRGAGQPLTLERVDVADPGPGELLVKLVATGVCHTDVAMLAGRRDWLAPTILGHEGAGHVVATGRGVADFAIGDPVVLSFRFCGACPSCGGGHPAYCDQFSDLNFTATRCDGSTPLSQDGTPVLGQFFGQSSFATHSVVDAGAAVKVDRSLPLEMLGPLACGVQTGAGAVLNILKPEPGSAFALFGAGSVGLSALLAARLAGCAPIIVVEPHPARRALACDFGATHVIDPACDDPVNMIRQITGRGAATSFDATSRASVLKQAFLCLDSFGRCGYVGTGGAPEVTLDSNRFMRGCSLHGVMEGDSNPRRFLPELIAHWRAGRFPFDRMIEYYPFAELPRAIIEMNAGQVVKPVLRFS